MLSSCGIFTSKGRIRLFDDSAPIQENNNNGVDDDDNDELYSFKGSKISAVIVSTADGCSITR